MSNKLQNSYKKSQDKTPIRTAAIVLRRTNYGESDRILNILTPVGKFSVIAKGVRKPKSKLAGGIELFCLSDIVIQSGKGDLKILTSAKMLKNYHRILADLEKFELASQILKAVGRITEQVASAEHFDLLKQSLEGIENNYNQQLIENWFKINFNKINGEEYNFYTDQNGQKLQPDGHYTWDRTELIFHTDPNGNIGANEIKFARLMSTASLAVSARVKNATDFLFII